MKTHISALIVIIGVLFVSCDGRTGYLDEGQLSTVSDLTDSEWLMDYADYGYGSEIYFDDDTQIYRFEKKQVKVGMPMGLFPMHPRKITYRIFNGRLLRKIS